MCDLQVSQSAHEVKNVPQVRLGVSITACWLSKT